MFSTVLRKRRVDLGYSQSDLADLIDISTSTLSKVENLDSALSLKAWRRLAGILKVKANFLYVEVDGEFFARERRHDSIYLCP